VEASFRIQDVGAREEVLAVGHIAAVNPVVAAAYQVAYQVAEGTVR